MRPHEPMHERLHLMERPNDWATASDEEWLDALCTIPRPIDPRFMAYARGHKPALLRQSLLREEAMSQAKGRRVGTRNAEGFSFNPNRSVMVYEALVPLICGRCGAEILIGDLFARSGNGRPWDAKIRECCGRCAGLTRA